MPQTSTLCPHCQQPLELSSQGRAVLSCPSGHRFDAAKQGYFNFLTGKGTNFIEDSAAMVAARDEFQSRGHYQPLAAAITEAAAPSLTASPLHLLDAGAGTGYYLGELIARAERLPVEALALDISRYAMRRAAKLPYTTAVVWDVWRTLPTPDASRDVVLNCFAPHNPVEFRRVLAPGGTCVVVTALPDHLHQVRSELGMLGIGQDKEQQLVERFAQAGLALSASRELRFEMQMDAADLFNLAFMGPAGHHLDAQQLRSTVQAMDTRPVTAAFGIYSFV